MSAKRYFAYLRVSTVRQGQTGTSLTEQRDAVERYAQHFDLKIIKEFEERETAAKLGRPVFLDVVKALKKGKADGVIMHKIDRSARNLKDWAELGELIDKGIEVHFANESLDLNSRGGRLSADIQAVVAADFIRNLREETKKGIYGRLKQGLYPFRAVVGYMNSGGGKPKDPDPIQAPLVRCAFELYSSGEWSLNSLVEEMYRLGLRSRGGRKVTRNGLATILKNPFYTGIIRLRTTKEFYQGRHKPIVSKKLYDLVQDVLDGKNVKKARRHFFVFSRHIKCSFCRYNLIAEKQKHFVYYRCQRSYCPQTTIREDFIETKFIEVLKRLKFNEKENRYVYWYLQNKKSELLDSAKQSDLQMTYQLEQIRERLSQLADAYMDGIFDEETFGLKKNELVLLEKDLREKLSQSTEGSSLALSRLEKFLEQVNSAYLSYKKAVPVEKRELVRTITSNFSAEGKMVVIKLNLPFQIIASRPVVPVGSPYDAVTRTLSALLSKLFQFFCENGESHDVES